MSACPVKSITAGLKEQPKCEGSLNEDFANHYYFGPMIAVCLKLSCYTYPVMMAEDLVQ